MRHTAGRTELGKYGEKLAGLFLREQGMQILDRNWRCARGEIDIVASDGRTLVFCEVKTRTTIAFGAPLEAVDERKSRRLRMLGTSWTEAHPGGWDALRFDVIGILLRPGDAPAQLRHVRGAF